MITKVLHIQWHEARCLLIKVQQVHSQLSVFMYINTVGLQSMTDSAAAEVSLQLCNVTAHICLLARPAALQ